MLDVATELDLALVPGFESELRCEVEHIVVPCTHDVTHLSIAACNSTRILKCASAVAYELMRKAAGVRCADCKALTADCWTLRPV